MREVWRRGMASKRKTKKISRRAKERKYFFYNSIKFAKLLSDYHNSITALPSLPLPPSLSHSIPDDIPDTGISVLDLRWQHTSQHRDESEILVGRH